MNEPIDLAHSMSDRAIRGIRSWVSARRTEVQAWEPRPCPPSFITSRRIP